MLAGRLVLSDYYNRADITSEAVWLQELLTSVLDQHARKLRVVACSKRWWGKLVKEARQAYAQAKRA